MKQTRFSIYGAVIGDYYGSYWEFRIDKPKSLSDALKLREGKCFFTDDTYMTLAIAKAIMQDGDLGENAVKYMREVASVYPASYGGSFAYWLRSDNPAPYFSWGNGASMRVSPAPLSAGTLEEAREKAKKVTEVTHDHPFALKYADMVSCIIFLAKQQNATKGKIHAFLRKNFPNEYAEIMSSHMSIKYLYKNYEFTESSQDTVPQAIRCFLDSVSFKDCLARSLYVGGDSDTLSAIACSMGAPFYGDGQVMPILFKIGILPEGLGEIAETFSETYLK